MTRLPFCPGRRRILSCAAGAGLAATLSPWRAAAAEPGILSVTTPSGQVVPFDEAAIAALPWQDLATHTAWVDGVQTFRGPLLRDVLTAATGTGHDGADDLRQRALDLRALNDYRISIPAQDAWDFDPVLARIHNGRPMHRRDKGPLWLVYPRDQYPELEDQRYDQRWVWQLAEIVIR